MKRRQPWLAAEVENDGGEAALRAMGALSLMLEKRSKC
jgi:hypothetical protein